MLKQWPTGEKERKTKIQKFEYLKNNKQVWVDARQHQNRKDHFGPNVGPNFFLEVLALLAVRHCPKLQPLATSGKTNDGTLRKFQGFYLDNVPNYHPMQFPGKLMN